MKSFFKKIYYRLRIYAFTGMMAITAPAVCSAQSENMGQQVLNEMTQSLKNIVGNISTLLQVVVGISALVCIAIVIAQVLKGDRESASKLAWWVAGLTIGFILIALVTRLIR